MTETTLSPVRSWTDWLRIRRLYRRAFPVTERKPFAIIRRRHRKGLTDVWCIRHGGDFAGFAATINGSPDAQGKRLILLDYLAVAPTLRGRGTGSAALQLLSARYGRPVDPADVRAAFHYVVSNETWEPGTLPSAEDLAGWLAGPDGGREDA